MTGNGPLCLNSRVGQVRSFKEIYLDCDVLAGVQGIEGGLDAPITEEDLSLLSPETLAARDFVRLPESLEQALQRMDANETVKNWFPATSLPVYLAHKESEITHLANMTDLERCAAYACTY